MSNIRFWFKRYSPRQGDVIVDIGAGRGEDLVEFSQAVGSTGKVIAIEADAVSYKYLLDVISENKIDNVEPLNVAVLDKIAPVHLIQGEPWEDSYVVEGIALRAVQGCHDTGQCAFREVVQGMPFDLIASGSKITRIDLLKMNIEGSEKLALLGMRDTIGLVQHAVICAHDFRVARGESEALFKTADAVTGYLQANGFQTERIPGWDHIHAWRE